MGLVLFGEFNSVHVDNVETFEAKKGYKEGDELREICYERIEKIQVGVIHIVGGIVCVNKI